MDKSQIIQKIKQGGYKESQLLEWLRCMPDASKRIKPTESRIGDVYMHPIFKHPYVIIGQKNDVWICTLMTSDIDFEQNLEQCKSRFFPDGYITKTLFTVADPIGMFMGVFDNNRQINSVFKKLKQIFI